jgi:3-hydroxyacyl-CoA dehydrogenase/enoyl-CoA hydratase/3-hydroxybutyryl-CoA epimerase
VKHWTLARDADGIAWLTFDKAGGTTNTLSREALAELNEALDELERNAPRGLVIRSGKANGFIAGADVTEFSEIHDAAGVREILSRGLATFDRVARTSYPTLALIRG